MEDHRDTLEVIRAILVQRGFDVRSASSVGDAERVAAEGFDLLLCDIDLPDGDGIELLRRLSAARPVRAIAMSGYGTADDVARSIGAGFRRHLVKPFTTDRLFEAIALALL